MSLEELEKLITPNPQIKEVITKYWEKFKLEEKTLVNAIKIGLTLHWCLQRVDAVVMAHNSIQQLKMNSRIVEAILAQDNVTTQFTV